jgi:hypothetical protein
MATQQLQERPIANILATIPDRKEVRLRIAENLQERQLLRKLLRLAEQRYAMESLTKEGRRRD